MPKKRGGSGELQSNHAKSITQYFAPGLKVKAYKSYPAQSKRSKTAGKKIPSK